MKPIDPGCLAMVVNCNQFGKTGTVGNFIGSSSGFLGNDWWEFSTPLMTIHGNIVNMCSESKLRRIDGYEEEECRTQVESCKI